MTNLIVLALLLGVLSGFVLGLGYFAALAWTTRRLPHASHPARLMLVSLLVRIGLLALGLVVVAQLSFWALAATLPGLIAARVLLVRRFGVVRSAEAATGNTSNNLGDNPTEPREAQNRG